MNRDSFKRLLTPKKVIEKFFDKYFSISSILRARSATARDLYVSDIS
jgi:hypothetical protein